MEHVTATLVSRVLIAQFCLVLLSALSMVHAEMVIVSVVQDGQVMIALCALAPMIALGMVHAKISLVSVTLVLVGTIVARCNAQVIVQAKELATMELVTVNPLSVELIVPLELVLMIVPMLVFVTTGFVIATQALMVGIVQSKFALMDALVMVCAPVTISLASAIQDGPATTVPSMLAQEIAVIMVIVSMEPAIARLVGQAKLVWRRLAHLIAIIKDTVLEELVFAIPNTQDVTVVFPNAQILALGREPALTSPVSVMQGGLVKIVPLGHALTVARTRVFVTMLPAIAS